MAESIHQLAQPWDDSRIMILTYYGVIIEGTVMPAYSDTLGERQKCHCKGGVTVSTYTLLQDKKVVIVGISIERGHSMDNQVVPVQNRPFMDEK